jgi:O-acetyl-ADP-ribose deacetylase (regulator of RNase III)
MQLHFVEGDATTCSAGGDENKLLVHCVNCLGVMGSGIAKTVRDKWPKVYAGYKTLCSTNRSYSLLGEIDISYAQDNIWVCNLFGQDGCGPQVIGDVEIIPFDYRAFRVGLANIKDRLKTSKNRYSLHCPRIGCGLALAEWKRVEEEIRDVFSNVDIDIYVYDFTP